MLTFAIIALAQTAASPNLVHDGGVCAGLSWVRLAPSEQVALERGPDFNVYRFNGPAGEDDNWWGVYSGRYASADTEGPALIERDGVIVNRAVKDGKFEGYLAEKEGRQNHFFGSAFKDVPSDVMFFARIDFSSAGQALCMRKGR